MSDTSTTYYKIAVLFEWDTWSRKT